MSLKVLRQHGWSIAAMAREFGLNWRTVRRALECEGPPAYGPRPRTFALNEAQLVHVERRLVACASIRGTDLHAELRHDYGYQGSYPTFQRQLRLLRPAVVRDPEVRFETDPGVQTQVDWAEMGLWPLGKEMVELSVMVAILGCSRAPALRFATDQTRLTSFERVVRWMFEVVSRRYEKASIVLTLTAASAIGARYLLTPLSPPPSSTASSTAPPWSTCAVAATACARIKTRPRAKTADEDVALEKRRATTPQDARND